MKPNNDETVPGNITEEQNSSKKILKRKAQIAIVLILTIVILLAFGTFFYLFYTENQILNTDIDRAMDFDAVLNDTEKIQTQLMDIAIIQGNPTSVELAELEDKTNEIAVLMTDNSLSIKNYSVRLVGIDKAKLSLTVNYLYYSDIVLNPIDVKKINGEYKIDIDSYCYTILNLVQPEVIIVEETPTPEPTVEPEPVIENTPLVMETLPPIPKTEDLYQIIKLPERQSLINYYIVEDDNIGLGYSKSIIKKVMGDYLDDYILYLDNNDLGIFSRVIQNSDLENQLIEVQGSMYILNILSFEITDIYFMGNRIVLDTVTIMDTEYDNNFHLIEEKSRYFLFNNGNRWLFCDKQVIPNDDAENYRSFSVLTSLYSWLDAELYYINSDVNYLLNKVNNDDILNSYLEREYNDIYLSYTDILINDIITEEEDVLIDVTLRGNIIIDDEIIPVDITNIFNIQEEDDGQMITNITAAEDSNTIIEIIEGSEE